MMQMCVFVGEGGTMAEATQEAEDKANDWMDKNAAGISETPPVQISTTSNTYVVDIPEGLTVGHVYTVTILFRCAP